MVKSFRKRIKVFGYGIALIGFLSMTACSVQKAQKTLLKSAPLKGAHVGIAVYNASSKQWIDKYQSNYYFTPASNTKILATFVAMQYLDDSLPGWKLAENKDSLFLQPLGDPSFLHPDFTYQPIVDLIKATKKTVVICPMYDKNKFGIYGPGWAWDDMGDEFQVKKARMPFLGNMHKYEKVQLLDTLATKFVLGEFPKVNNTRIVRTVPTDSLLKIMMSRSDNFYAEQLLLMAGEKILGRMDDMALIDTVKKMNFKNLPQEMKWVDGSGLSRYNLNTPENFVAILMQMQNLFGIDRLKQIFEKAGEGTLTHYYKNFPGVLYAKTGTLSNQVALSGFMFTEKNNKIFFSVLVNNAIGESATSVRKAVEMYLTAIAKHN